MKYLNCIKGISELCEERVLIVRLMFLNLLTNQFKFTYQFIQIFFLLDLLIMVVVSNQMIFQCNQFCNVILRYLFVSLSFSLISTLYLDIKTSKPNIVSTVPFRYPFFIIKFYHYLFDRYPPPPPSPTSYLELGMECTCTFN